MAASYIPITMFIQAELYTSWYGSRLHPQSRRLSRIPADMAAGYIPSHLDWAVYQLVCSIFAAVSSVWYRRLSTLSLFCVRLMHCPQEQWGHRNTDIWDGKCWEGTVSERSEVAVGTTTLCQIPTHNGWWLNPSGSWSQVSRSPQCLHHSTTHLKRKLSVFTVKIGRSHKTRKELGAWWFVIMTVVTAHRFCSLAVCDAQSELAVGWMLRSRLSATL
jgi:hypothetical protein